MKTPKTVLHASVDNNVELQHTPMPWKLKDDRSIVSTRNLIIARTQMFSTDEEAEANAAYIVESANLFPRLVKALEDVLALFPENENIGEKGRTLVRRAQHLLKEVRG